MDISDRNQKGKQAECPSEDESFPFGREMKAITIGEGGMDLRGKVDRTGEWKGEGNLIWYRLGKRTIALMASR